MMGKMPVLSLSLVLMLVILGVTRSEVYLIDNGYTDTTECLQSHNTHPCHSLEYLANNIENDNVVIKIISSHIEMLSVAQFSNIKNITIKGERGTSTIMCNTSLQKETGISFENSSGIHLMNLNLVVCSANFTDIQHNHDQALIIVYGILVYMSQDVHITNITVSETNGFGLVMVNNANNITITNSEFINNTRNDSTCTIKSGGMLIQHYKFTSPSYYVIHLVKFIRNGGFSNCSIKERYSGNVYSGGLRIFIIDSKFTNAKINNTIFKENMANYGGGFHALNSGNSQNNAIDLFNSEFISNIAHDSGGGADVGFLQSNSVSDPKTNFIMFRNCTFRKNKSKNRGVGGLSVFTSFEHIVGITCNSTLNLVIVNDSVFTENKSKETSALKAILQHSESKGLITYTVVVIIDCTFKKNKAKFNNENYSIGATVLTLQVSLVFHGSNIFDSNKGAALLIDGAIAVFNNSNNTFSNNVAERGAGIYLINHSYMEVEEKNIFTFAKNKARYGAGILATQVSPLHLQELDHCFLKGDRKQSTYVFQNNTAVSGIGKDMFIYNLYPCLSRSDCKRVSDLFEDNIIGNFTFDRSARRVYHHQSLTTAPSKLTIGQATINPIPGKEMIFSIHQHDQFKQKMKDFFILVLNFEDKENEDTPQLASAALVTSNATFMFRGRPGSTNLLNIKSELLTTNTIQVTVKMNECLPGYIYVPYAGLKSCECSYNNRSTRIPGIAYCNNKEYALLEVGYWAGYIDSNDSADTSLVFVTGPCLHYLCSFTDSKLIFDYLKLNTTNKTQLEEDICVDNRTGVLCSQCLDDTYSVFYNSPNYSCKKNTQCSIGFLYFILVEIVPTTVLFLFILLLNVNLTSGSVYTLIFYIQILHEFNIDGTGLLKLNKALKVIQSIYQSIYGIANLNFIQIERLSFCIWKGAKILDIITLKYIVAIYAITLILGTVALLKLYSFYTCIKLCQRCGKRNIRYSVVHSLSAFILICYFGMINISIAIVSCEELTTFGDDSKRSVALFDGSLICYSKQHLVYMVPAIICLLLLSAPPILLIAEPLLLFVMGKFKLEIRSKIISKIRIMLKPYLDSFQGCFKNNCRVFAGLFFSYRIVLSTVLITGSSNVYNKYCFALTVLIVIITLHATVRPFAVEWHNRLDLFLLVNMTTIILLSLINITIKRVSSVMNLIAALQLILGVVPFVFITIYLASIVWKKYRSKKIKLTRSNRVSDGVLFARMTTRNIDYGIPFFNPTLSESTMDN